jgi:hypothetical protein
MARIRFSLATLMAIVLLAALGLVALRNASALWANATFTATLTLLLCAVLGLILRRHHARAFWLGFALFGWTYVLLVNAPWLQTHLASRLITDTLLSGLHEKLFRAEEDVPYAAPYGLIDLDDVKVNSSYAGSTPPTLARQHQYLAVGTGTILRSTLNIDRVQVLDESLLDLVALDTNEIRLVAKAQGITKINVWDANGRLRTVQVAVKHKTWTPSIHHVRQVGHSLFTLLFALLGGYVARCFHTASEK